MKYVQFIMRLLCGITVLLSYFCIEVVLSEEKRDDDSVKLFKCLGRIHDPGEKVVQVPPAFMSNGELGVFGLVRKELTCKKGRFKVLLQNPQQQIEGKSGAIAKVLKTDTRSRKTQVYEDSNVRVIRGSGYLRIGDEYFHPVEYCIDQIEPAEISLFVCFPECYGQRPCVVTCCGQDEVWDVGSMECRHFDSVSSTVNASSHGNITDDDDHTDPVFPKGANSQMWEPSLFSRSIDNCVKRITPYHRSQISIHYQSHRPSCPLEDQVLVPLRKTHNRAFQRFRVLWTGSLVLRDKHGNWTELNSSQYCVDGMVNYDRHSTGPYTGAFEDQLILVCKDQLTPQVLKKTIPLKYAMMLLVSAVVLFLTCVVSCLLWDERNVYEWTISCEVFSMLMLIAFVGVAHTVARRPEKSDFGSAHCVFIGAASHFFWLSTFTWLFIINFEIWWNFRSLVQLRQSRKWFRFSLYQLVGWGCPLAVVLLGLLLDKRWGLQKFPDYQSSQAPYPLHSSSSEDLDCTTVLPPNYGQMNCYIAKPAQGPYIFYPIGFILGFNLVFYLLTVCKMWGYQKKSSEIIQYRSRNQTQPIVIFARLFIVMGVSWVFEIVSWGISTGGGDVDKIPLYWVVFDIVTMFQSFSIFLLFCWKKEVISKLWWRYPRGRVLLSPLFKLPRCSLLPNERDRNASIQAHNLQHQQVNKVSRERGGGSSELGSSFAVCQQPQSEQQQSNGEMHQVGLTTI